MLSLQIVWILPSKQVSIQSTGKDPYNEQSAVLEFQARMRENDSEPPYNVASGKYDFLLFSDNNLNKLRTILIRFPAPNLVT